MLKIIFYILNFLLVVSNSKQSFFPKRPSKVPIFIRPNQVDVFNGHAKPKRDKNAVVTFLSLPNTKNVINELEVSSIKPQKIGVSKTPIISNKLTSTSKYFVTWRPDLHENNKNVIITVRTNPQDISLNQKYRPQHFFSQIAHSSSTLPPFLIETAIALQKPSASTSKPKQSTTPTWSYKPVFNPIFDGTTSPKYAVTHKFSSETTPRSTSTSSSTTSISLHSNALLSTATSVKSSISTTPLPQIVTSSSQIVKFGTKIRKNQTNFESLQESPSNTILEVEDTITKSPFTILAYIRYLASIVFRILGELLYLKVENHSDVIDGASATSTSISSHYQQPYSVNLATVLTIFGLPLITGFMFVVGFPTASIIAAAWLSPLLTLTLP